MPKAASQKTAAPSAKICGKSANFHPQGGGLVKSRKRLHTHAMAQLARSKWAPALLRERALRPATNGRLKLCYELQCSCELPLTAQLQAASYSTASSYLLQHSYKLPLTAQLRATSYSTATSWNLRVAAYELRISWTMQSANFSRGRICSAIPALTMACGIP